MNKDKGEKLPLSFKANEAFRQAAKEVIKRAQQTGTPVIIWEEGRVKEIPGDRFETTMAR
ncbi:MAG: hypothetical protein V1736_01765 [Pseudomonadota bacterium]